MLNPTQPFFYLLAYLAVLYVRPHEYVPWLIGVPILPVLLVTSTVLWLGRQPKDFTASQFKLLPTQTFLMAWSVLVSGWLSGAITVITEFFPVVLLFYMLATSVDSITKLRQIFIVLSLVMFVIALHSIDQAETGTGWTGATMVDERITYLGFLNDPNDLSMAFVMVLPMVLYLSRHSGWIFKIAWLGVALAILYAVKLANSRGAVLSLAAMMLHYGIFRFGLVRSLFVGPVLLLPIIIFGPSRMNEISSDEESAEGRIDAWHEGFDMLKHHPLFGVGKGQFTDYNDLTAHNSYVLALAELGLIGYFVWLSGIALTWLMVYKVQAAGAEDKAAPEPELEPVAKPYSNKIVSTVAKNAGGKKQADKKDGTPGAVRMGGSDGVTTWGDIHEGTRTLWYGYLGALVSMFFLSRSYVTILYVHLALMIAMYQLARKHRPDIPLIAFGDRWGKLLGFAMASAVGLWVATAILLRTK